LKFVESRKSGFAITIFPFAGPWILPLGAAAPLAAPPTLLPPIYSGSNSQAVFLDY